jgi:hypothetical protein
MTADAAITVDTARLPLLLAVLRLPSIARLWPAFTDRADREGWPAGRLLAALAEAHLPPGKTFDSFDFTVVPMLSKTRPLRAQEPAGHRQPALWRVERHLPRSRHDGRGNRPSRPSRHDLRAQCRELSPPGRPVAPTTRRLRLSQR